MAVPHKAAPHGQGTILNSFYGDGPEIEKVEGIGNAGHEIQLTEETIQKALLAPYYVEVPKYKKALGPVLVKVINPFKIPNAKFELKLADSSIATDKSISLNDDSTYWTLKNLTTGEVILAERAIGSPNEQMFTKWGLSVTIQNAVAPGNPDDATDVSNGYISGNISFANSNNAWLTGVPDEVAPFAPFNWIRSGNAGSPNFENFYEHDFAVGTPKRSIDPRKGYKLATFVFGGKKSNTPKDNSEYEILDPPYSNGIYFYVSIKFRK
jgi:hypothetical protein